MNEIIALEPSVVWNNFSLLNKIPRPSKKEDKVRKFIVEFGNSLGLETSTDEVGNVLIRKPASKGMENRKTVVLQSHLDMVCQKNNNVDFDFETMGINMFAEDGFVKAKGTTLGADNGIGVAAMMSILESKEIEHPAIEALFTIDEETGMTGALELKPDFLSGTILLNLDTEEDDELDIGCAGGVDVTAERIYQPILFDDNYTGYKISVEGLVGGHSGMDIHKGFGNSNKILARILFEFMLYDFHIGEICSGGLRNAIPREGFAKLVVSKENQDDFLKSFDKIRLEIIQEYKNIEPNLKITIKKTQNVETILPTAVQTDLIKVLLATQNGVYRMSPDIEDLVETSNNLAKAEVSGGMIKISCLARSSSESNKMALTNTLKSCFELGGFKVNLSGDYPGWKPNADSEILKLMKEIYFREFKENPKVVACHAGLECGIIGNHYPKMDMISFGPNIYGAHSPDEKVEIKSVLKFWNYLLEVLKNIPEN